MNVIETGIEGLILLEPKLHYDARGYFYETFRSSTFEALGIVRPFVQDNQAYSDFGTLRGLHYQVGQHAQAKLVRVIQGEVLDVVVDIRPDSVTFGKSFSVLLNATNHLQMYVPRGFAHGYLVRSSEALFVYKCDNYYHPSSENGLYYADPELNIDWGIDLELIKISEKDLILPHLKDIKN